MPTTTSPTATYIILAVIVVLLVIGAIALARRNRSKALHDRFGPEYERTLRASGGNRTEAERDLERREDRVKRMHIEQLPAGAKSRYTEEWHAVQTRFVDEPRAAVVNADQLIADVMRDRGYPTDDFHQTVEDLSPDHPHVLQNYRAAHGITQRTLNGDVSTEDLRQAMVHYRSLFDDLVNS